MKIEITHQIRVPYANKFLNKGTQLEVEDVRGAYYICKTDDDSYICVHKEDCVEVKENA